MQNGLSSKIPSDLLSWGEQWTRLFVEQGGAVAAWLAIVDVNQSIQWITEQAPSQKIYGEIPFLILEQALHQKETITLPNEGNGTSSEVIPLTHQDQVVGLIRLDFKEESDPKSGAVSWRLALSRIIAAEIVRETTRIRDALTENSIYRILQASVDVQDALPPILEILANRSGADLLTALRYKLSSRRFELLAVHSSNARSLAKIKMFYESHPSYYAIGTRQPVWIADLAEPNSNVWPISPLVPDGFHGYLAIPLIGHYDLLGVLEFSWRNPARENMVDIGFMERVAEQISFAIERTATLKELAQRNAELVSRYDAMIEGLSRSLELRDLETEGHTRRVSTLTMRLVEHIRLPQDQWDAIKQGALLHDIGKLGIPDAILLKPGSLTAQERKVMEQHPLYGYNILAPIISSRQTLDIALHHHERWDGSGYPYGLKAERIPLVARLFAVVDVFDAVTSDRPYRPGWPRAQAIEYLREQAGHQFDPQVVQLFLQIIQEVK